MDMDNTIFENTSKSENPSVIMRYFIEYENTTLKEDEFKSIIKGLENHPSILNAEKERNAILKRLNEVYDRYRLNPYVIEKDGKFFFKYIKKNNTFVLRTEFEENKITTLPKIDFKITKISKKSLKEENTNVENPIIPEKLNIQVIEKPNIEALKEESKNKKRIIKDLSYPILPNGIFGVILNTDYKKYKEKIIRKPKSMKREIGPETEPVNRFVYGRVLEVIPKKIDIIPSSFLKVLKGNNSHIMVNTENDYNEVENNFHRFLRR